MNLLLSTFSNFADSFVRHMKMPSVIVALVLTVIGISLTILAKRIAKAVRKTDDIADNDSVMISLKVVAIVCLLISILILVFRAGL
jgi:xanthine/uracil permease